MKARAALEETSFIENTVYQQCEKGAKTTVDLARCAVRAFDSRDYNRKREIERPAQKPVVNISIKKSASRPIIPPASSYSTSEGITRPVYSTQQDRKYNKMWKGLYYKKGFGYVKNPIRAQTRRKRIRRDTIDDAWDVFLAEEREKQKRERIKASEVRVALFRNISFRWTLNG